MLEAWQKAWREGFVPFLSLPGLKALKQALQTDDNRLIQGVTPQPAPLQEFESRPVEGACPVGYCGWQGEGLASVGEVEEYFVDLCVRAEQALGDPTGGRYFLNWVDDTPRPEMRRLLLEEVNRALKEGESATGPVAA